MVDFQRRSPPCSTWNLNIIIKQKERHYNSLMIPASHKLWRPDDPLCIVTGIYGHGHCHYTALLLLITTPLDNLPTWLRFMFLGMNGWFDRRTNKMMQIADEQDGPSSWVKLDRKWVLEKTLSLSSFPGPGETDCLTFNCCWQLRGFDLHPSLTI